MTTCSEGRTTWSQLEQLYEIVQMDLQKDLREYANHGYIFSGPGYFIMGRQIGNGWYVQAAVGERPEVLRKFAELMPYWLPHIGCRRQGKHNCEVVWYPTDKIIRKITYARRTTSTTETTRCSYQGSGGTEHLNAGS